MNRREVELHFWTNEEKEYLKEITPGKSHKEITELINKRFEYQFTTGQIKGAINRYKLNTGRTGYYEKGNVPFNKGTKGLTKANKTSFKKGDKPINYREIGSERINVYGYTEIKVGDPGKWTLKHKVVWEEVNGPVPPGYAVVFGDRNKRNLSIENLILMPRKKLLVMNRNNLIKNNIELTKVGVSIANIYLKINEL